MYLILFAFKTIIKKYSAHPSVLSIKEKMNNNVFSFREVTYEEILNDGKFPDQLKKADVSPVFKKRNHNDKTNFRPVSILPSLSKIYERLIYNQINQMTENALSIFQCGSRKNIALSML